MIEEGEPFALTGVVVAEVLQGLTRDSGSIEQYLAQWDMIEPRGFETYRERRLGSIEQDAQKELLLPLLAR